jgi:4-amino-4-deoxy-L-arabinose transferase-like glycosyltransferase
MPDIGLLQGGPRRPRAIAAAAPPIAAPEPQIEAAEPVSMKVAARSAAPEFAILRAPRSPETSIEIVARPAPAIPEPVAAASRAPAVAAPVVSTAPHPGPAPDAASARTIASATSAEVPVLVATGVSGITPPPGLPPDRFGALPPVIAQPDPHAWRWQDLAWLSLALLLVIGTGLGIRDPWPADEPRFAAVARDMVLSHEWLFPRVGGDLYQDKPPLFFWLLALGYTITGSVRASFLIPSFVAAGAVLFLVYDLGRRLAGRVAGLAAGVMVCVTLQFVVTMRGAQIDPLLCGFTTLSLYGLLRHLLLGPRWGWYALAGFAAGLGVITKGVGFLPMLVLVPYFLMRRFRWKSLPDIGGGWRWWLAPLAMLVGIGLWFVPMLTAVAAHGPGEYAAYRDEILFKQTVGRYAAAWHHVKGWYYFIAEVVPPLWLPWSLLLFWLVPRYKRAWLERDARVWLPLAWVLLVLVFFSASPGKRGIYIHPAVPALALASLPFLEELLARKGVRIASIAFALLAWLAGVVLLFAPQIVPRALTLNPSIWPYVVITGALVAIALWRKPVAAYAAAVAGLAIWFSYFLAPQMNGERSGSDFTKAVLTQVNTDEQLALVAYKEQFLLYLDRPTVNFGHRRFLEGPQEAYDASAWLNQVPQRVLLVPASQLTPCFRKHAWLAGEASGERWYLARSPAESACAEKGDPRRAIYYQPDHARR